MVFPRDRKACSTDDMSSKQVLVFKLGLGTVAGFCLWQPDIATHQAFIGTFIIELPKEGCLPDNPDIPKGAASRTPR